MCERYIAPCQDTSVSLDYRSMRTEDTVKTLHFSDLSLLHEEVTITIFAIHAYTQCIYFVYLLYTPCRPLLPICLDLFLTAGVWKGRKGRKEGREEGRKESQAYRGEEKKTDKICQTKIYIYIYILEIERRPVYLSGIHTTIVLYCAHNVHGGDIAPQWHYFIRITHITRRIKYNISVT